MKTSHEKPFHVLVVDDDPIFRALIRKTAQIRHVDVTTCGSIKELAVMGSPELFDVAVVDFYLDNLHRDLYGTEIAGTLERTPVVLVSQSERCLEHQEYWPTNIKKFMTKRNGANAILDQVLNFAAR